MKSTSLVLYNFLISNTSVGPYATEVSQEEIQPGDIIQLGRANGDFYHTLVVTVTSPQILIAAHTYDTLDRPLNTYNYYTARFLHIEGVRVW